MKKVLLMIIVVFVLGLLCALIFASHTAPRSLIAKVRYLDGSLDTIRITEYSPVGGSMWLKAEDGHVALIGANNVIIVEDEEYWEGELMMNSTAHICNDECWED